MTPDYIRSSVDTFPLELIEIQQMHLTLFSEVSFDELTFQDGHVRLQCERELKALLIGLRQVLLASAGEEKFIGVLEVEDVLQHDQCSPSEAFGLVVGSSCRVEICEAH